MQSQQSFIRSVAIVATVCFSANVTDTNLIVFLLLHMYINTALYLLMCSVKGGGFTYVRANTTVPLEPEGKYC